MKRNKPESKVVISRLVLLNAVRKQPNFGTNIYQVECSPE